MDTDHQQESCTVPPGFRFHPTDEELVGYYLRKKVASQKIDLDVIRDIDLYRIEPWDLQEKCGIGYEEQNEWYFFSHKDKKYPTGTRTNRATIAGFWKATGRDKAVYDKSKLIGMRKTLVFYKGRAPNGQKSDWIMHEYRLESEENAPPQAKGWVVCRAFKKRITGQLAKSNEGWESNYCLLYDHEHNIINNFMGIGNTSSNNNNNSFMAQTLFMCKQELDAAAAAAASSSETTANFTQHHSENNHLFNQLPQLQSPSLPLLNKYPAAAATSSSAAAASSSAAASPPLPLRENKKVTDWRTLDKFVASQLSHDDDNLKEKSFTKSCSCEEDMDLLLQNAEREEGGAGAGAGNKLSEYFLSTSGSSSNLHEDNIGIFIFDR
ncbi:unnamed protein product [Cuscuta europaea]|uniref:NAC domain-containing protein n=1 Tax=Cuscuta europaea TaxID=41803 RepID=A0A9P0ZP36_CUSEU|nr:unnamed protein product [Cuscuta europaea]